MSAEDFSVGQVFTGEYTPEAAEWCNSSAGKYYIAEIEADGEGNRRFEIKAVAEPTFEELQEKKLDALSAAFTERTAGSITTTQGYVMQFGTTDSLMVQGAITLLEATGAESGYLTQADDTTVYGVPLDTMKAVLAEMLAAFAQCHADKQVYRAEILACETAEELDAIAFTWSIDAAADEAADEDSEAEAGESGEDEEG